MSPYFRMIIIAIAFVGIILAVNSLAKEYNLFSKIVRLVGVVATAAFVVGLPVLVVQFFTSPAYERLDEAYYLSDQDETDNREDDEMTWSDPYDYTKHPIIDTSKLSQVMSEKDVERYYHLTMDYLSHVPPEVLDALQEKGWTIILTTDEQDENICDLPNGKHMYGYTEYKTHRIVLEAYDDMIGLSAIHEVAHALYVEYLIAEFRMHLIFTHDAEALTSIYYHDGYNTPYVREQIQEAIAQSFYEYICYPQQLQTASPTVYQIWHDLITNLQK